jgi:prenyltransferase beta subunit
MMGATPVGWASAHHLAWVPRLVHKPWCPNLTCVGHNMRPRASADCRAALGALKRALLICLFLVPIPSLGQEQPTVDAPTEAVIKGALKYLAANQAGNGSWAATEGTKHEVAVTGYVLLAFLANGQLPDEGEYGKNVTAGVNFLLNCVQPNGFIQSGTTNMYGHGVATVALAEVYGQSRDPRVRAKLEAAVKLIVDCQNAQGGWRYEPKVADADMSVTVLQVVALRAAKNAGLEVPQQTIDRAVAYVRSCHDPASGGFTYQPGNKQPGFARTAAAIYSLQVCGQYDDPRVRTGLQYMLKTYQSERTYSTYGHFYAAPAAYMIGGQDWRQWYSAVKELLLKPAKDQGMLQARGDTFFWQPKFDGGMRVGPVYTTAVYAMILAMPYHYVPLYQR